MCRRIAEYISVELFYMVTNKDEVCCGHRNTENNNIAGYFNDACVITRIHVKNGGRVHLQTVYKTTMAV